MYWINLIGSVIITILTSYIFVCNFMNKNIRSFITIKKTIIFILLTIMLILNGLYMTGFNKVFINLFILIILYFINIFDYDIKKSIYYVLLFFMISSFVEIILAILSSIIFHIDVDKYQSFSLGLIIYSTLNSVVVILISKSKKLSKLCNYLYMTFQSKIHEFLFLSFIAVYAIILCFINCYNWGKNIEFYANFGMFIFITISTIFMVNNIIQKNKTEDKYNQMMEYVSKYEKIINEQGKRNHEFNNQLMVLNGYVNDKKKLKEYLESIISEQRGGQNYRIKQLGALPDGGIKGLIYYKLSKMEEKDIKSFLYVEDNLKKCFDNIEVDFYRDITKVFGVFIDNAIEAANESIKKEIEIDIRKDEHYLIITISNTFKENIDVSKIGKKGYTSKGLGHGFGLSIVKEISKKNDKIETFCDIEVDMFKQTLIIDLRK